MTFAPVTEQLKEIKRGTVDLLPENELIDKLNRSIKSGKPLHIKMGFDPTAPDIHLGHTVGIRKLRQFQDLGHKVIVIIGDYTATVGDPSDKKVTRPRLKHEDVLKNAETYKKQMLKILKAELTEFRYNGEWFKSMPFSDVMSLAASTTVAQMLERNDFSNRYKSGQPISLHEFFYPLMQAYDSVMIDADVELGATEQKFNLVMGRTIQEAYDKEKQCILTLPVLVGLDGVQRMSKSLGNYIGIDESAKDIYGKTLSIPDEQIYPYFELVTDVTLSELEEIKKRAESDPRNTKRELARKLVTMYHSEKSALDAEAEFDRIFINKDLPDKIAEYEIRQNPISILDLITDVNFATSKGEARRLIRGNGVSYNNEKITDENLVLELVEGHVLKVGKKRFVKTV
ncbi:MAG: tyrosine--tRNA ligase [Calditrichaeota bacterium]|nr:tyrosine--tRNA ligase [Calditrichota bacterium]